ncbi:cbb3-type cytochrome c oxidase subunit 3 [Luteithermobacter gelatinilyticus]|uniref:cbb3-type cytochrome c oxidase subunit 3 n=1 Tax=Luteithermobacter gelatinilyticus TaxID=2582913 RepID=UPI00143CD13C|nr:cbb3-type cytochrome c oxidase subunit 3 [Luteithermobacter gelatinilyticus]|tara:strand:- start:2597 stop:2752 length:156 start_codon:yes stop_codon:yes gene_type:complete
MDITHQDAASFAQTWGLVFFVVMFLAVVAYALWPKNKDKFKNAARTPLDEE